jgi:hypothetical protein
MSNKHYRTKQQRETLIKVMGMTNHEYQMHQIGEMQKYVEAYAEGNLSLMIQLLNSKAFENWYINAWNMRNKQLYHKYCLSSYLNRQNVGRKLRITPRKLKQLYVLTHMVEPEEHYPNSTVMQMILKESAQ